MSRETLARKARTKQARDLLLELVNLRVLDPVSVTRFQKRFGHLMPTFYFAGTLAASVNRSPAIEENRILILKARLEDMWKSPDERTKQYYFFRLVGTVAFSANEDGSVGWEQREALPVATPFEKAVQSLARAHTHRCQNPDCPAPYFLATRRTQKYCEKKCAEYGQREAKKRWWAKQGREWRETRQQSRRGAKKR